jgi:hypothetical protein
MGGTDILLDRKVAAKELLPVVAALFDVSPDVIYLPNYTPEDRFSAGSPSTITITLTDYTGDFLLGVGIYTDSTLPNPQNPEVIRTLCRLLGCRALIEPLTPPADRGADSIFWLVSPAAEIYRVVVKDELLDNEPSGFVIDLRQGIQPVQWPPLDHH